MAKTKTVWRQDWETSTYEPGWGVDIEEAGYTLHLTEENARKYVETWVKKNHTAKETPSCYRRTSGEPFKRRVKISIYNKVKKSKLGLECC